MLAVVPYVNRSIKTCASTLSAAVGRRFAKDERGVTMMIFAFVIPLIIGFLGGAIDVGNTYRLRSKLQNSLDTAVLAAARAYEAGATEAAAKQIATEFMRANMGSDLADSTPNLTFALENGAIKVTASVSSTVDTFVLNAFHIEEFPVTASSVAIVGREKFELAFVFDNSGSMRGSKISTLKDSAMELVEALMPDATSDTARIGLVPFNDYVNIGMAHRSEPGLDVPDDYSVKKKKKTKYYGWYGCAASRGDPLNTQDASYATKVPGLMTTSDTCDSKELMRLTNVKSTIESGINSMNANGWTYIPSGLIWGWRVLSDGAPFADKDPNPEGFRIRKIMIVMTDGANTRSVKRVTGDAAKEHEAGEIWKHSASNETAANTVTADLCENIKNDQITVFTIAFDVTNNTLKNLLSNCAGNGGAYYDAGNNAELVATFNQIAEELKNLRIAE